ncbi:MAG: DUF2160 domain-containing protein [Rhodospirillales bacterium]
MGLTWMAWTWPTAAFFGFIALCLITMTVWELKSPSGPPRRGVFRLATTRGDRLFISLLGSAYIFLAWLGFVGAPLYAPLVIAVLWAAFVFRFG